MDLSIVIPVFNEEKIIKKTLHSVFNYLKKQNYSFEIIVVNDGSADRTGEIIKEFSKQIKIIDYVQNRGKGYALRQGVAEAKGEVIYIADADFSTPINEIEGFLNKIGSYDCVVGSRAQKGAKENSSKLRILAGKFGNLLITTLLNLDIKDTQCGFKMFRKNLKEVFTSCKTNGFGYDFEFLLKADQQGFSIKEIPVKWKAGSKSSVSFRSYINTLAELIRIWWREVGLSRKFFKNIFKRTRNLQTYIIGGVITNVINFVVFFLLLRSEQVSDWIVLGKNIPHYVIIETISFTLAILFNFFYHKYLTFKTHTWDIKEVYRYIILLVVNYLTGVLLLYLFVEVVSFSEEISKILSSGLVIVWNFFILKFFVYKTS